MAILRGMLILLKEKCHLSVFWERAVHAQTNFLVPSGDSSSFFLEDFSIPVISTSSFEPGSTITVNDGEANIDLSIEGIEDEIDVAESVEGNI